MVNQVIVSPDRNRADLVGDVQTAWTAFANAIQDHPLANVPARFESRWPETIHSVAIAVPQLAPDAANDSGLVILGERCLDAVNSAPDRNLTLLHETIHMVLMTSTTRDRTAQVDQIRAQSWHEYRRISRGATPEHEMHAYYRLMLAFEFTKMPDEVWAELYLRDHYPALSDDRMSMYLRMRDNHARRTQHTALQGSIRRYYLAYEWFTLELARRIDGGAERLRRLDQLQTDWRADLITMIGNDEACALLDRVGGLLPVNLDAIDVAQFDQLFADIVATPLPN